MHGACACSNLTLVPLELSLAQLTLYLSCKSTVYLVKVMYVQFYASDLA